MSKNNPFCLSFGKEPDRYVERADKVYDKVNAERNILMEKMNKN